MQASNNWANLTPAMAMAINRPRRHALDLTGVGAVPSDHWHKGHSSIVVSRNHNNDPGVHFYPHDGVGVGVAMTECEYGQGIALASEPFSRRLPVALQGLKVGILVFTWPGYQHLKSSYKIKLVNSDDSPVSLNNLASQVGCIWRRFYQSHCDHFDGNGVRLGPTEVTFNQLRLHQIYTHDGRTWQAEVSYIVPLA